MNHAAVGSLALLWLQRRELMVDYFGGVDAIRRRSLYVFTLPESMRPRVVPAAEKRGEKIQAAIATGVLPDP